MGNFRKTSKNRNIVHWAIFITVTVLVGGYLMAMIDSVEEGQDAMLERLDSIAKQQQAILEDKEIMGLGGDTTFPEADMNVIFKTNKGDIEIELYTEKAPETVANFVKLANEDFYDGTKFHRVIKDFMIQGGDPLSKNDEVKNSWGTGGPGYMFKDEINDIKLVRGVLAMANAGPNTNGSQFFIITLEATPWLDGKHTAFGKVISGMDIVDTIENTEVEGPGNVPVEDMIIEDVIVE